VDSIPARVNGRQSAFRDDNGLQRHTVLFALHLQDFLCCGAIYAQVAGSSAWLSRRCGTPFFRPPLLAVMPTFIVPELPALHVVNLYAFVSGSSDPALF
jgi:hypothetical protein